MVHPGRVSSRNGSGHGCPLLPTGRTGLRFSPKARGCGRKEALNSRDRKMLLRCGGYQGADSVHTRALRVLEAEIGGAGSGVEVELTPNITAQGRKASDLLTLVESGDLDLCYFSSSYL